MGPFGSTAFSCQEARAIGQRLNENLTKAETCTRPGPGGVRLTYIEGWKVIQEANLLFGFNGWTQTVLSTDIRFIEETPGGRYSVCVSALVRVTLRDGAAREDRGGGTCEGMRSKGDALLKAEKEAITDATKRALKNFGPRLGLCLYDKLSVREMNRQPPRGMAPSGWVGGASGRGPQHGQAIVAAHHGRASSAPLQHTAPLAPQNRAIMAKQEQQHAPHHAGQHPRPNTGPPPSNMTTGYANRNVNTHRNSGHPNVAQPPGRQPHAPNATNGYVTRNVAPPQHTAPKTSSAMVPHRSGASSSHQQRMPTSAAGTANRNLVPPRQAAAGYAGAPSTADTPQRNAAPLAGQAHQKGAAQPPQHTSYVPPQGAAPGPQQQRVAPAHGLHRPQSAPPARRTSLPAPGASRNNHPAVPQNAGTVVQGSTNAPQQYNLNNNAMHHAPQGQPAKPYAASPVTPAGPRRPVGTARPTPPSRSGNLLNATPPTETAVTRAQPVASTRVAHGYRQQGGGAVRPNSGGARPGMAQYSGTKRPNSAVAGPATQQREQRRQRAAVVRNEIAELQNIGPEHFNN